MDGAVQLPLTPERFAIHKLIVADRHRSDPRRLKSRKDRAQTDLLIKALSEARPGKLAEAYEDAIGRGISLPKQDIGFAGPDAPCS
ncbi:GSU2403 family nucleotidyltransferase fold protein [Sulfitobacter sp. 1A10445]|uniref:GSU2403 family nucleotidyltransferase fold protein n=1 Tax=unclassified Sulfitobacter TaxID=196795 RepID=UPI003746A7AB